MTRLVYPFPQDICVQKSNFGLGKNGVEQRGLLSGSLEYYAGKDRVLASCSGSIINRDQKACVEVFLANIKRGEHLVYIKDWEARQQNLPMFYDGLGLRNGSAILWSGNSGATSHYWNSSTNGSHEWLDVDPKTTVTVAAGGTQVTINDLYPNMLVKKGVPIKIGNFRYLVTENTNTNAAGLGTFKIAPRLVEDVPSGTSVMFPGDKALFHMTKGEIQDYDEDGNSNFNMNFVEVFEGEYVEGITYVLA